MQSHHDFFQRGVPCSFADPVDGALDLPRPPFDGCHEISDGHAEVIVSEGGREGGREGERKGEKSKVHFTSP